MKLTSEILISENRMLFNIILTLVLPFLLFKSDAANPSDRSQSYEDADAYEVYSAILPLDWTWGVAKAKTLVIRMQTNGYEMCVSLRAESKEALREAISEYVKLNEKPWLLQRRFSIEKPYDLISYDELKSLVKQGGWENFYKQHPHSGGWIELSAVGFNTDKTVAVVYMGHHCGGLCGGGGFHILQKRDGKWRPMEGKGYRCFWDS
jgi:hypothetical protein